MADSCFFFFIINGYWICQILFLHQLIYLWLVLFCPLVSRLHWFILKCWIVLLYLEQIPVGHGIILFIHYWIQFANILLKAFMCKLMRDINMESWGLFLFGFGNQANLTKWRRKWQPTPVFLPGEFHGVGYSPWGHKELDTTEWLTVSQNEFQSILFSSVFCKSLYKLILFLLYMFGRILQ